MMDYHESVSPPWTTARPAVPFSEATRESARAPVREDLTVPAGVVAVGGLYVFLFVVCLAFAVARLTHHAIDVAGVFLAAGAIAAGADAAAYIVLTWHVWADLNILGTVERIIGLPPVQVPALAAPSMAVEVQKGAAGTRQTYYYDLPGPPDAILDWADSALSGQSLSYRAWTERFGYTITPRGAKVALYGLFREKLTRREPPLALEQGTHSITLTEEGIDFFMDLSAKTAADLTPLLTQGNDQN